MAWTHEVTEISPLDETLRVRVVSRDSETGKVITNIHQVTSLEVLKALVLKTETRGEAVKGAQIVLGTLDTTPASNPLPADELKFISDLAKYKDDKRCVDLGLLAPDDSSLLTQKTALTNAVAANPGWKKYV